MQLNENIDALPFKWKIYPDCQAILNKKHKPRKDLITKIYICDKCSKMYKNNKVYQLTE